MSGAQQSRLFSIRRGRRGVTLVATLAVLAGALGIAPGSAASPVGSGSVRQSAAGDEVVSPAAVPQCRAYVTNSAGDSVSVLNTATNTIADIIAVGDSPDDVTVAPGGATVYVANSFSGDVSVIDTATNTVTANISVGVRPSGLAVTPDGAAVYVTNDSSDDVSVIDTATNTVTATINVGEGPVRVAVTPDGAAAYVSNSAGNTVSVINTATNTVDATIPVGAFPFGVAVAPDGATVYVTNNLSNDVSVIDTATNTVTSAITVSAPVGVAVAPDGTAAYVANLQGDTVTVIDLSAGTTADLINVGDGPFGLAVAAGGATVYATNFLGNSVSVINTATYSVVDTISVGEGPRAVAVGPCSPPGGPAAPGVVVTGTGTVEATVARPSGAAPVSFEVTADPGGGSCTVSGESGSCVISGLDASLVYTFTAVASNGAGSSPPSAASVSVTPGSGDPLRAGTQFGDVSASTYYARGVDMLFQHGITTGKGSATVFAPGEVVSRAQMATFLWRMAGEPTASACSFTDQADIPTSARVAACWLKDNDYTTEDRYRPEDPVTRAQMAAFLFRIWGPATFSSSCGFNDEGDIPSWAQSATCWMKDNDITTGLGDTGDYGPRVVVSRGQMAAFLYRLGGYIEERWLVIID